MNNLFGINWELYWCLFLVILSVVTPIFVQFRAMRFAKLDPQENVYLKLFWQGPLASVQANKVFYWLCMGPIIGFIVVGVVFKLLGMPGDLTWQPILFFSMAIGYLNIMVCGPKVLVVSVRGLFWWNWYSWGAATCTGWKSDQSGEYFCFTLPPKNNEYPQETKLGPISAEDRERIEEVLAMIPQPEEAESES